MIFEFKCDFDTWLIGFSFGRGTDLDYYGRLRFLCINLFCFSWMWYQYLDSPVSLANDESIANYPPTNQRIKE